jgi:hypothetical protein
MGKAMKAMVAAAGLPALDDAEAWGRIGAWWRERGEGEADLTERISELEAEAEEHEERTTAVLEEARAAREYADLMKNSLDQCKRELEAARADNAALRKVIDKFTMTVPAVVVGQVLDNIVMLSERAIASVPHPGLSGRLSLDEQRWLPILRAILNDAGRARTAMEAGK